MSGPGILRVMTQPARKRPGCFKMGCGGLIALAALSVVIGALGTPGTPTTTREVPMNSNTTRTPAPAATTQPGPATALILKLARTPDNEHVTEKSQEEDRQYYTWGLGELGQQVGGIWRSEDDWWVKITGRAVSAEDVAGGKLQEIATNGAATTYLVTSGPLKDVYLIESAPTLHVQSAEYYNKDH